MTVSAYHLSFPTTYPQPRVYVGDEPPNDDIPPPCATDTIGPWNVIQCVQAYMEWLQPRFVRFDSWLLSQTTGYDELIKLWQPYSLAWTAWRDDRRPENFWSSKQFTLVNTSYNDVRIWHSGLLGFEAKARAMGLKGVPNSAPTPQHIDDVDLPKLASNIGDVLKDVVIVGAIVGGIFLFSELRKR